MDGLFYFSTGAQSRKARNLAKNPHCTICTDQADEAVILEGAVEAERQVETIRNFIPLYEKKYKWKLGEIGESLIALKDPLFYLRPKIAFGLWEKKFDTSATKWIFEQALVEVDEKPI
jgi:Pyridoxamine 5'-phosphate oxidase